VADYRVGDWKNAGAALEKSEELAPGELVGSNGFFLAMTHWQLGEKAKARQWYSKAAAWMYKNQPTNRELVSFRAEASTLLGLPVIEGPSKDVPPKPTAQPFASADKRPGSPHRDAPTRTAHIVNRLFAEIMINSCV
jgi:hypothetical protein